MKTMQTINLNGRELPVPVGCPDFRDGFNCIEFQWAEDEWAELTGFGPLDRRHAAACAHSWFVIQADIEKQYPYAASEHDQEYQDILKYEAAARAWLDELKRLSGWADFQHVLARKEKADDKIY